MDRSFVVSFCASFSSSRLKKEKHRTKSSSLLKDKGLLKYVCASELLLFARLSSVLSYLLSSPVSCIVSCEVLLVFAVLASDAIATTDSTRLDRDRHGMSVVRSRWHCFITCIVEHGAPADPVFFGGIGHRIIIAIHQQSPQVQQECSERAELR